MKRSLVTAAAIALLYDRQRRVERRQKLWKLRTEADLRRWLSEAADALNETTEANQRWGEQLVKQIERAFKEGAR